MHLPLDLFGDVVKGSSRSNAEKALAVLWYLDAQQVNITKTSGQLTKILIDYHIATPNQTALAEAIRKTKLASETKNGFALKPGSRRIIREWFSDLVGMQPPIDHKTGYLPEHLWQDTRGYIESVCCEQNGCFQNGYYNAAAVMQRRLLETLIIEAYEHLGRQTEIKDGGGNYYLLGDLTDRACGEKGHAGLNLGRDSKKVLKDTRNIGNWSAHARRYIAHAEDLLAVQISMRILVQELMFIANLHRN